LRDHVVDCIAAAAADADYFDDRFLGLRIDKLDHYCSFGFLVNRFGTTGFSGCFLLLIFEIPASLLEFIAS
jgi:hypothetical protein